MKLFCVVQWIKFSMKFRNLINSLYTLSLFCEINYQLTALIVVLREKIKNSELVLQTLHLRNYFRIHIFQRYLETQFAYSDDFSIVNQGNSRFFDQIRYTI